MNRNGKVKIALKVEGRGGKTEGIIAKIKINVNEWRVAKGGDEKNQKILREGKIWGVRVKSFR